MILLCILAALCLIILVPILFIVGGGLALFGWVFLDIAVFVIVVKLIIKLTDKK